MSVLINMEMPTLYRTYKVRFSESGDGKIIVGVANEDSTAYRPIGEVISVPPHGDLIERYVAYDKIAEQEGGNYVDMDAVGMGLSETPVIIPAEEKEENFCADCHWFEVEEQYCFRKGCHAYNESTCEHWEPVPSDEPIPAPGGKTVPTTYDLLYEEGGLDA